MLRIFEALGTGFVRFCWISQRCCSTCPWRVTLAPSEAKKIAGLMDTILIGGTKNIFKMDVHPTKTDLNYCNRFWPTPTWYQDVQWSGDITGYNQRICPICLCLMTSKLNMFAGENGCWLNMVCVCKKTSSSSWVLQCIWATHHLAAWNSELCYFIPCFF